MIANTFQDEAANLFSNLPLSLRDCIDPILFFKETRKLPQDKVQIIIALFFPFIVKINYGAFNLAFSKFILIVIIFNKVIIIIIIIIVSITKCLNLIGS